MSEHEEQQQEETEAEAETETESASSEDSEMAGAVDERAGELTGSKPSPQPEGTAGDPIGDAEQHIASLDMDEERRKVQQLSKDL